MKKWLLMLIAVSLLLTSGCSVFKVKNETFSIPQEAVQSIEFQREYKDEAGKSTFRSKKVTEAEDLEEICDRIRYLKVVQASADEPHAITEHPMIIILRGAKDHYLILAEDMVFYDQIAYEYAASDIFDTFAELYDHLDYEEADTEAEPF